MKFSETWGHPPRDLNLSRDDVHVWRVFLRQPKTRVHQLQRTLSEEEQIRAGQFYFVKDKEHFIVARGVLRNILGRYLQQEPGELSFCYNSYGKPALSPDSGGKMFSFNVSHSAGIAIYAITYDRTVGIDVEHIRPEFADDKIAERFFSPAEVARLRELPASLQKEAFFACWTRKEAFIKATGQGVSFGLDNFEVSLTPGEPASLISVNGDRREAGRWSLKNLTVHPGYAAAICVEGQGWRLQNWEWTFSHSGLKRPETFR